MRSALFVAVFALLAIPARAQTNDARWEPWLGCWTLAVDNLRDRQAPEGPPQRAARPSTPVEGAPRVCVSRTTGGVRFETTVGTQTAIDQAIIADGSGHPVNDDECSGTQRIEWSKNGLRLFSSAEIKCKNDEGLRRVTGLSLMAPNGDWVDIQTVSIGGRETVRVKRYYRAADSPRSNRPTVVSARLTLDEVVEASAKVSSAALEAALVESNAGFDLTAKKVQELDSAGVSERVIDLIVALSYPDKFVIQRMAQVSPGGQATYVRDPFLIGFGSPYYYDPFYYGSPYLLRTIRIPRICGDCVRPGLRRHAGIRRARRLRRVGFRGGTGRQRSRLYARRAARLLDEYAVEYGQDVVDIRHDEFGPVRRLWLLIVVFRIFVLGLFIGLLIGRVRRWKHVAGWFHERRRLERLRPDSDSALALRLAGARSGQAESSLQLHDHGAGPRVNRGPAHQIQHLLEAARAQQHAKIDHHDISIDLNPLGHGFDITGDRAGHERERTRGRYRPSQPQRRITAAGPVVARSARRWARKGSGAPAVRQERVPHRRRDSSRPPMRCVRGARAVSRSDD